MTQPNKTTNKGKEILTHKITNRIDWSLGPKRLHLAEKESSDGSNKNNAFNKYKIISEYLNFPRYNISRYVLKFSKDRFFPNLCYQLKYSSCYRISHHR